MYTTGTHICTRCKNQFKWVHSVREKPSTRMSVFIIDSNTVQAFYVFSKETNKNELLVRCKNCDKLDIISDYWDTPDNED